MRKATRKTAPIVGLSLAGLILAAPIAFAADYLIDTKGAHASIQFKIRHLQFGWVVGGFNTFEGQLQWDSDDPNAAAIQILIDAASIDTNHALRDKRLKGGEFFDVDTYPTAAFKSNSIRFDDETSGIVTGDLTLRGITNTVSFPVVKIGEGPDPWGGHRVGFEGAATLTLADYGITFDLGPTATDVELYFVIEAIRQ